MGFYLLLALGAAFTIGSVAWAVDAWGGDDDGDGDTPDPRPDPDETLTGTVGLADLLDGRAGDDTITGDLGEADTLRGGSGEDTLVARNANTATGGRGADTFVVDGDLSLPDTGDAVFGPVLTDFDPEEDTVTIRLRGDGDDPTQPPGDRWFVWRESEDLVAGPEQFVDLQYLRDTDEQKPNTPPTGFLQQRLGGVAEIPPDSAVRFELLDETGAVANTLTPDQMPFFDLIAPEAGPQSVDYTEAGGRLSADLGGGDDSVAFAGRAIEADLGEGNDLYEGRTTAEAPAVLERIGGGPGNDVLRVTVPGPATNLFGEEGNDTIELLAPGGTANGGPGNDLIVANGGSNVQLGEGDDTVRATTSDVIGVRSDVFDTGSNTVIITPAPDTARTGAIFGFDPANDSLVIELDEDLAGDPVFTFEQFFPDDSSEPQSNLLLNGDLVARLDGIFSEPSALDIVLVTPSSPAAPPAT